MILKSSRNSSHRLQKRLSLYSAVGIFGVSLVVALVSATPLYITLKNGQEQDFQSNLETRTLAVSQSLEQQVEIAEQITSRTRARQLLAAYHQGEVNRLEAKTFNRKILLEAMRQTDSLVGISRFDQNQELLARVGVYIPDELLPNLDITSKTATIHGPVKIAGAPYLLTVSPIFSDRQELIGHDLSVFALSVLQEVVEDYSGLGETGETILAAVEGNAVDLFFPLRSPEQTQTNELEAFLKVAITNEESGVQTIADSQIIAFQPVPNTNWAIAVKIDQEELYSSVNQVLVWVGLSVFGLSTCATVAVVLGLKPLIKRVIDADELQKEVLAKTETLEELKETQVQLVQAEKMSSLGQLVAGIAHEINNPMNFIHGNLTHLETSTDHLLEIVRFCLEKYAQLPPDIEDKLEETEFEYIEEDLPKMVDSIRLGSNRIREIVLSLKNFSRLDEAAFKPVNIHEGIDSTLLLLQNRIKPRPESPGIEIIKNYGQIPDVECYAGQLNQVFMNLLVNAIDALEEHTCDRSFQDLKLNPNIITITTEVTEQDTVAIAIADNGPGIPAEVHRKLFDPFFTTKPIGKGTGMGLSISQQIIHDNHQGKLVCNSQLNQGTEFVIELPLQHTEVCAGK